jgi:hypothetical protein
LAFLATFSWVNLDLLGLLGFQCVNGVDYRTGVAMSCMLPVLIVGYSAIVYFKSKIQNFSHGVREASQKERNEAISSLFDLVDADKSGYVEPNEFKMLLQELNHKRLDMNHVKDTMTQIVKDDHKAGDGRRRAPPLVAAAGQTVRLSRQQFIGAAMSGSIADTSPDEWFKYVKENREWSQILSTAFQLLGNVPLVY